MSGILDPTLLAYFCDLSCNSLVLFLGFPSLGQLAENNSSLTIQKGEKS